MGLNLSSYEIKNIADQLFGGTKTFQKGQIGSYKDFFNKSHYEDFYRVFNDQMEDLSLYYDFFESLIYRPHIQLSVMKSGTGLTERLLELLCDGEKKPYNIVDFLHIKNINLSEDWYRNFSIPKKVRLANHFFKSDTEFINQILLNNKSILALVNIRDPRDTCVSLVHFFNSIKEENRANYSKLVPKNWDDLSEDEKLSFAISRESTLAEQFENALNTNKLENTLLIKFENLVGQRGGGSDSLQLEEIQKVVDGLQMHYITDDKLHQIANSLFGAGWTFRKGEIGGYKEAFKDHHYVEFFEAFKDVIEPLSKYYDFSI